MIIIDYGDLLRPISGKNEKRHELESIYEEMRAIAQDFDCPLWTASQTNRSGLNAEVITLESISEAFSKCFVADFIFSVSRTVEDKSANSGRVYVAKNRNGPDGLIYPILMDTSKVSINVLPLNTNAEATTSTKNQSELLKEKWKKFKYAKFLPRKRRRETYEELVTRNKKMHIKKYPQLKGEINEAYKYVYDKKILPSMRSMQFGGKPIAVAPNRIFNCAYLPIDDVRAFGEIMFLLLGGTGVGYSVQAHHVEELPEIVKPSGKRTYRYLIGDSIEGWADAVKALVTSYFRGTSKLRFDFSDIRPKGSRLVTSGGKAPGPQPLKECLVKLEGL